VNLVGHHAVFVDIW